MGVPESILIDLTRRYCEPHRRYHTIEHVADMLWMGRELALSEEQLFAIWYHDAIYEVPGKDNERASAELAGRQLRAAGWAEERVQLVERMVHDTILHEPTTEASKLVLDLDLGSLAHNWDHFVRNTANIREEYAFVDDEAFYAGQRTVFERFLGRERIFYTEWGAAREQTARDNLQRAIELW